MDVACTPTQAFLQSQAIPSEIETSTHARLEARFQGGSNFDMRSDSFVVGRDPSKSQLVVHDKRISGQHFKISKDKYAYYVEALGTAPTYSNGQLLPKGEVRRLSHGDKLSLLYNSCAKIPNVADAGEKIMDFLFTVFGNHATNVPQNGVESRYEILQELGSGNFSKVYCGMDRGNAKNKVAIKKINVEIFEKFRKKRGTRLKINSEEMVMKELMHPNIVQLIDVFESPSEMCLVMELCDGGDLLHNILQFGAFPEDLACKLFKDLIDAIKYLHDREIVHRDLKPENVLLTTHERETTVAKITDFGLAIDLEVGAVVSADARAAAAARQQSAPTMQSLRNAAAKCRTFCGTPHYFAPEVIAVRNSEGSAGFTYGKEVDMWSMGVILYIILSSVPPFDEEGGEMEDLYKRITGGDWAFDVEEFDQVSDASKDLVSRLMSLKAQDRLTVTQAVQHMWFEKLAVKKRPLESISSSNQIQATKNCGEPIVKHAKLGAGDSGVKESKLKENVLSPCADCASPVRSQMSR